MNEHYLFQLSKKSYMAVCLAVLFLFTLSNTGSAVIGPSDMDQDEDPMSSILTAGDAQSPNALFASGSGSTPPTIWTGGPSGAAGSSQNPFFHSEAAELVPDEILVKVNVVEDAPLQQSKYNVTASNSRMAAVSSNIDLNALIAGDPELSANVKTVEPVAGTALTRAATVLKQAQRTSAAPAPQTEQAQEVETARNELAKWSLLKVNADKRDLVLSKLNRVRGVKAHPNFRVKVLSEPLPDVSFVPNDAYLSEDGIHFHEGTWRQDYPDLFGLRNMKVIEAWEKFPKDEYGRPRAGEGVLVAVVDSGVDVNHPDLNENIYQNLSEIPGNGVDDDGNGYVDDVTGWDFANGDNDPKDGNGHGTHVAGTIAAVWNNGQGIAGVAPGAKILPVKGLSDAGSGSLSALAEAVVYAADMGAHVINNSWGGSFYNIALMNDAMHYARAKGSVVVCAAGNDNSNSNLFSPAGIKSVISVSAFTPDDGKASFSNFGKVDVAAPGGGKVVDTEAEEVPPCDPNYTGTQVCEPLYNILSLNVAGSQLSSQHPELVVDPDAQYLRIAGTSMASPHVAGAAALIISYNMQMHGFVPSPEEVREILKVSADDILDPLEKGDTLTGFDHYSGAGRVNVLRALEVDTVSTLELLNREVMEELGVSEPSLIEVQINVAPGRALDSNSVKLERAWAADFNHDADVGRIWTPLDAISLQPAGNGAYLVRGYLPGDHMQVGAHEVRVEFFDGVYHYEKRFAFFVNPIRVLSPAEELMSTVDDVVLGGLNGEIPVDIEFLGSQWADSTVKVTVERQVPYAYLNLPALFDGRVRGGETIHTRFDSAAYQDGVYYLKIALNYKIGSKVVYSQTTNHYFRVNNGYFATPLQGRLYKSLEPIPFEAVVRPGGSFVIQAAKGSDPDSWTDLQMTQHEGRLSGTLHPESFAIAGNDLIALRIMETVNETVMERERLYFIFDLEQPALWPVESPFNSYAPSSLTVGDIDGDGVDELLQGLYYTGVQYGFGPFYVLYEQQPALQVLHGSGVFNSALNEESRIRSPFGTNIITLSNLSDLPGEEILFGTCLTWATTQYLDVMNSDGSSVYGFHRFEQPQWHPLGPVVRMRNIDRQDWAELVTTKRKFNNAANSMLGKEVLVSDGNGNTQSVERTGNKMNNPVHLVADLDRDGRDELIINSYEGIVLRQLGPLTLDDGKAFIEVMDAKTLELKHRILFSEGERIWPYPAGVRLGDLDGDGDLELIVFRVNPYVSAAGWSYAPYDVLAYELNQATNEWMLMEGFPYGSGEQIAEMGPVVDTDGDGKDEIIILINKWDVIDDKNRVVDWVHSIHVLGWGSGVVSDENGWPQTVYTEHRSSDSFGTVYEGEFYPYLSRAVIGDLDGDPWLEMAVPAKLVQAPNVKEVIPQSNLSALLFYNLEDGTPAFAPQWILGSVGTEVAIGNIGTSDRLQLLTSSGYFKMAENSEDWAPKQIYSVFNLPVPYEINRIVWGQQEADAARTGYVKPVHTVQLQVNPGSIEFGSDPSQSVASLKVENAGAGMVRYQAESNSDWLSLSSEAGEVSSNIRQMIVMADRSRLSIRNADIHKLYEGQITLTGHSDRGRTVQTLNIPVSIVQNRAPVMKISLGKTPLEKINPSQYGIVLNAGDDLDLYVSAQDLDRDPITITPYYAGDYDWDARFASWPFSLKKGDAKAVLRLQNLDSGTYEVTFRASDPYIDPASGTAERVLIVVNPDVPPEMQFIRNYSGRWLAWLAWDLRDGYDLKYSYRIVPVDIPSFSGTGLPEPTEWTEASTQRYASISDLQEEYELDGGSYLLEVKAIDSYGNISEKSAVEFFIVDPSEPAFRLSQAVSRAMHGRRGSFDISLINADGSVATEPRAAGVQRLMLAFDGIVKKESQVNLLPSSGRVVSKRLIGNKYLEVILENVSDRMLFTLSLSDKHWKALPGISKIEVMVRQGDVNADGKVDGDDIEQVRRHFGHRVVQENFKYDVTRDGVINRSDLAFVRTEFHQPAVKLVSAFSRKFHGKEGPMDIKLALNQTALETETRKGGPTEIVLHFSRKVSASEIQIHSLNANMKRTRFRGEDVHVLLGDVQDRKTVVLSILQPGGRPIEGDHDVHVNVRMGDVNEDGFVSMEDLVEMRRHIDEAAAEKTMRFDVDSNGVVNILDMLYVKKKITEMGH